ncbi:AbrB/MazE/SpoVT family DNA-binding domain-containing protein [Microbacterium betulae]|uniref:AbrB/MazE/SpoVT family DNA-binding domain-containing protein n=1 Tax=Microbacterium betulae TaxID=2981139 RepID=A0AA97I641_9MICO|nr:AbrB/MazE/SpoVT family DNA-binding domain-containing protein [Microbacterium sp. AB]WOF22737.1 AbrB/MazE/SpoVT family DNA-binding domain-containing protein [Microbacterium sp. AB]
MLTTMDKAGRVVIPASLRARIGLVPGPIDVVVDGSGLRIEIPATDAVETRDGFLVIAADGPPVTADGIRELRLADQR